MSTVTENPTRECPRTGILLNASTKHFFLENVVNEIGVCRISRHAVI